MRVSDELVRTMTGFLLGVGKVLRNFLLVVPVQAAVYNTSAVRVMTSHGGLVMMAAHQQVPGRQWQGKRERRCNGWTQECRIEAQLGSSKGRARQS